MNIWVICQYYKPEPGAPSARLSGLSAIWKKAGVNPTIFTGIPNHPKGQIQEAYKDKPAFMNEEIDGVPVRRHWLYVAPNEGKWKRAFNQLSFALSVLFRNLFKCPTEEKPDVIMASSPSFFCVASAWILARRYKAKFVFEVRDLWPAIFVELGILRPGFVLNMLTKMEMFLYKRADAIVSVSKGFAKNMVSRGVDASKIYVIPNGVSDVNAAKALAPYSNNAVQQLRTHLQLNPLSKIVMYIGNHGDAQALGQVVDAARLLTSRTDIIFLMVGGGADKERLKNLGRGVPNLQFIESQPPEKVWDFYALSDISLVCLKDVPSFDNFIPSKMFEIMASQTPMVAGLRGEGADILNASNAAVTVPPETPEAMAQAIATLIDDAQRRDQMAKDGRRFVQKNYLHSQLGAQYLGVFAKLTGKLKSE